MGRCAASAEPNRVPVKIRNRARVETIAAPRTTRVRCTARGCFAVLIGILSLAPASAGAQSSAEREQARTLAARGFEALQHKDYAAAEDLFRRADALVHAPTLVVDHARALVGLGKLVEGHEGFELVLREGVPANAPRQWKQALQVAAAELAAVEPRLAWLTISISGAQDPSLEIDDKPIPKAVLGVRRATNPGSRVVRAHAPGFLPAARTISLREGQSETLELRLEPDPAAVRSLIVTPAHPVVDPPPTPSLTRAADHTLPTILLSAGGVALLTGAVTGFIALRTRSELKDSCAASVCTPSSDLEYADYRHKLDRYRALGTASGVALAMGAGAALSGAALLIFSGPKSNERAGRSARSARLALTLSPARIQVSGGF